MPGLVLVLVVLVAGGGKVQALEFRNLLLVLWWFSKRRAPLLGVPRMRIVIYWDLNGPPVDGNPLFA